MAGGIRQTLGDVAETARCYGVLAAVGYVFDHVRVGRAERAERFDERHGSATEGKVYPWQLSDLDVTAAVTGDIHPYEAFPARLMRRIIRSLPISSREFAFVDLGSGKGRALLVASEFFFSRIVGVEISRDLNEIAVSNIRHYISTTGARSSHDLHCMNASQYEFDDNLPLVVFLFNPFGKETFDTVVSRLEDSLRRSHRDIFVIYANPRFEKRLNLSSMFRRVQSDGSKLRPWRRWVVYRSERVH
jgi:SAM-dependent methyltransferase